MKNEILPKAIFIDWYKTLSNSQFWFQLREPSHLYHKYQEQIENALYRDNRELINPWMRGEYSSEDICKLISKQSGIDTKIVFEELKNSCENLQFIDNRVFEIIKNIRNKGINVSIATDNMDTFSRFTVPALGLDKLFDDILISSDLKHLKGDFDGNRILFFENYLKEHKLKFSDAVLIDDCIDKTGIYDKLGFKIMQVTSERSLYEILFNLQ